MATNTQTLGSNLARSRTYRKPLGRLVRRALLYLLVSIIAFSFFAPFGWSFLSSLKDPSEVMMWPPRVFPKVAKWSNYAEVFVRAPFALFFKNTVVVVVFATIGSVVSTILVGFGFSRKRFPGRDMLFYVLLSTMMLPSEVTLIPQFLMFKSFGWLDTLYPLIVPSYFAGAFNVFLMRQFLMTIPIDFDEAAMLDGASSLNILFTVLLPSDQASNDHHRHPLFPGALERLFHASDLSEYEREADPQRGPALVPGILCLCRLRCRRTQGAVPHGRIHVDGGPLRDPLFRRPALLCRGHGDVRHQGLSDRPGGRNAFASCLLSISAR